MLQDDADSCFRATQASKRPRWDDSQRGPRTAEEAFNWPRLVIDALRVRGMEHLQTDCAEKLRDALLQKGLCFRSDYSGIGAAEEALHQLVRTLSDEWQSAGSAGVLQTAPVVCQRAGDILPYVRDILRNRPGTSKPQCVHADIMHRCPARVQKYISELKQDFLQAAQKDIEAGCPKQEAFSCHGRAFIKSVVPEVFKHMAKRLQSKELTASCCVHMKECPVLPAPPEGFEGLSCNISGINCYDWSAMGVQKKWLGDSAEPFIVWVCERLHGSDDFCIVECVAQFDDATLAELVQEKFTLLSLRVCPTTLGLPITRNRKYMVMLSKNLQWDSAVEKIGHQRAFELLFSRFVCMKGSDFMRAPEHEVQAQIAAMAARRGLPSVRSSGKPWSFFLASSKSTQGSVQKHEDALEAAGFPKNSNVFANLAQDPEWMGPVLTGYVPALLRSSALWNCEMKRALLPMELLELQGFCIYGEGVKSGLAEALEKTSVSDAQKRSVAGNAMHVQCVGSVLCFVLSCTSRKPSS